MLNIFLHNFREDNFIFIIESLLVVQHVPNHTPGTKFWGLTVLVWNILCLSLNQGKDHKIKVQWVFMYSVLISKFKTRFHKSGVLLCYLNYLLFVDSWHNWYQNYCYISNQNKLYVSFIFNSFLYSF